MIIKIPSGTAKDWIAAQAVFLYTCFTCSLEVPLPVADLFQILAIFGNVLFVFYQFVIHLLDQEGTSVS